MRTFIRESMLHYFVIFTFTCCAGCFQETVNTAFSRYTELESKKNNLARELQEISNCLEGCQRQFSIDEINNFFLQIEQIRAQADGAAKEIDNLQKHMQELYTDVTTFFEELPDNLNLLVRIDNFQKDLERECKEHRDLIIRGYLVREITRDIRVGRAAGVRCPCCWQLEARPSSRIVSTPMRTEKPRGALGCERGGCFQEEVNTVFSRYTELESKKNNLARELQEIFNCLEGCQRQFSIDEINNFSLQVERIRAQADGAAKEIDNLQKHMQELYTDVTTFFEELPNSLNLLERINNFQKDLERERKEHRDLIVRGGCVEQEFFGKLSKELQRLEREERERAAAEQRQREEQQRLEREELERLRREITATEQRQREKEEQTNTKKERREQLERQLKQMAQEWKKY